MLTPAVGRNARHRALDDLEQGLLDAFARDIAGYREVLCLLRDLVDLIYIDDAHLGAVDVVVCSVDELEQYVLDVLAHIAGLGEGRCVCDGEGDVQHPGQGLGKEGLAAARGAQDEDVALGKLHLAVVCVETQGHTLVVVVDGDGEGALCGVLTDDVLVEQLVHLHGGGEVLQRDEAIGAAGCLRHAHGLRLDGDALLDHDVRAHLNALVADVDALAGDELLNLFLALATE